MLRKKGKNDSGDGTVFSYSEGVKIIMCYVSTSALSQLHKIQPASLTSFISHENFRSPREILCRYRILIIRYVMNFILAI